MEIPKVGFIVLKHKGFVYNFRKSLFIWPIFGPIPPKHKNKKLKPCYIDSTSKNTWEYKNRISV